MLLSKASFLEKVNASTSTIQGVGTVKLQKIPLVLCNSFINSEILLKETLLIEFFSELLRFIAFLGGYVSKGTGSAR